MEKIIRRKKDFFDSGGLKIKCEKCGEPLSGSGVLTRFRDLIGGFHQECLDSLKKQDRKDLGDPSRQ